MPATRLKALMNCEELDVGQGGRLGDGESLDVVLANLLEEPSQPQRPLLLAKQLPGGEPGLAEVLGDVVEDLEEVGLASSLEQLALPPEVALEKPRQRGRGGRRRGFRGPQHARVAVAFGVERQEKGIVVGRRSQAVHELGEEARHDGAAVEPGEVNHAVEPKVVHDEEVARLEVHQAAAHPYPHLGVERAEQLEAIVPGPAAGVALGGVVEELDEQGEFAIQPDPVAPSRIELRGDVVRLEREPSAGLHELAQPFAGVPMPNGPSSRCHGEPVYGSGDQGQNRQKRRAIRLWRGLSAPR